MSFPRRPTASGSSSSSSALLVGVRRSCSASARQYAVRFTNVDLLASVAPTPPGLAPSPRGRRASLLALALIVLAFAKPARTVEVPRETATVMLALDVSNSMQATDVEPTRLRAAQRRGARRSSTRCRRRFRLGLVLVRGIGAGGGAAHPRAVTCAHRGRQHRAPASRPRSARRSSRRSAPSGRRRSTGQAHRPLGSCSCPTAPPTRAARTPRPWTRRTEQGVPVSTIAFGTDEGTVLARQDEVVRGAGQPRRVARDRRRHRWPLRGGGHREGPAPHLRETSGAGSPTVAAPPGHDVVRRRRDRVRLRRRRHVARLDVAPALSASGPAHHTAPASAAERDALVTFVTGDRSGATFVKSWRCAVVDLNSGNSESRQH